MDYKIINYIVFPQTKMACTELETKVTWTKPWRYISTRRHLPRVTSMTTTRVKRRRSPWDSIRTSVVGVVAPHAVVKHFILKMMFRFFLLQHFIYVQCIEIYGPARNLNVLFEYALLNGIYCNTEKAWWKKTWRGIAWQFDVCTQFLLKLCSI